MTLLKRLLTIALVLFVGVAVVACGSDSDSGDNGNDAGQSAGELEGTSWELLNIGSDQGWATSLPKQVDPATIEFTDGRANIFAGCNSGSGEVEVTADTITFGPVAMTQMSCGRIANQFENLIVGVLEDEAKYRIEGEQLIIDHGGYNLIFNAS